MESPQVIDLLVTLLRTDVVGGDTVGPERKRTND